MDQPIGQELLISIGSSFPQEGEFSLCAFEPILQDSITVSAIDLPQKSSLLNLYPNPFQQSLFIELTLNQTQSLKLQLIDLNGKIIQQVIASKRFLQGVHQFNISTIHLEQGIYFLILATETKVSTYKVIKV